MAKHYTTRNCCYLLKQNSGILLVKWIANSHWSILYQIWANCELCGLLPRGTTAKDSNIFCIVICSRIRGIWSIGSTTNLLHLALTSPPFSLQQCANVPWLLCAQIYQSEIEWWEHSTEGFHSCSGCVWAVATALNLFAKYIFLILPRSLFQKKLTRSSFTEAQQCLRAWQPRTKSFPHWYQQEFCCQGKSLGLLSLVLILSSCLSA